MSTTFVDSETYPLNKSSVGVPAVVKIAGPEASVRVLGEFFGSEYDEGFKTKLYIHTPDNFAATLEFQATVKWNKEGRVRLEEQVMRVNMTSTNITTMACTRVDRASNAPDEVKALFAEGKFEAKVADAKIFILDVDYTAAPLLASNVYTTLPDSYYGSQASSVSYLREVFKEPRKLRFYVSGVVWNQEISGLDATFGNERATDPLTLWYPSHPNNIFLQTGQGQYPEPEDRPTTNLKAKHTFASKEEYVTILGFGTIQEHEHSYDLQQIINSDVLPLRVMSIPGAGNRRYFAFLEKPEGSEARLCPGDAVSLNFDRDIDVCMDDWNGFVVEPAPFAAMNDVTLIITRPWDKDARRFRTDVGKFEVLESKIFKTEADARRALMNAPAVEVSVRVKSSDKDMKRQVNSLRMLQDINARSVWDLLMGNNFSKLGVKNIFISLDATHEQLEGALAYGSFNEKQLEAANMSLTAAGGMCYFQGPPGCGKTHFLLHLALPFLLFRSKTPRHSGTVKHQLLLTAAVNDPIDDMARRLIAMAKVYIKGRTVVIIRYHAMQTEVDIVNLPAEQERGRPENARPEIIQEDEAQLLDEMLAAQMVKRLYDAATYRPHGVADKRVKQLDLALGTWMLKFAGEINDPVSDPDNFRRFRILYTNYKDNVTMSREDRISLRNEMKALRNHVLKNADVVVTTLSNCADPIIRQNIRPDFIGVDEAGKATEPNLWHVLASYDPSGFVQVGDQRQIEPVVTSAPKPDGSGNCFAPQLRISNFARTIANGFETVMFEVQDRMVPDIGNLVSYAFFDSKLRPGPSTLNRPRSEVFCELNASSHGNRSAVLMFNTSKSFATKDSSSSSYNMTNAVLGIDLLMDMLTNGIKPEEIMIVVPYVAQAKLYVTGITRMQEFHPELDLRGISVKTIDKAQGLEKEFVILDLVVTQSLGFINSGRLCVAESRARDGMYIILNVSAIDQLGSGKKKVLNKTLEHFKRNKLIIRPEHKRRNDYLGDSSGPARRGELVADEDEEVDENGFAIQTAVPAEAGGFGWEAEATDRTVADQTAAPKDAEMNF